VVDVWELAQDQQGALLSMDNNKLMRPESQQETVLSMNNNEITRPERRLQQIRIVNVYDNTIGKGCTWQGAEAQRRQALKDVSWEQVIQERVLLVENFNTHSAV